MTGCDVSCRLYTYARACARVRALYDSYGYMRHHLSSVIRQVESGHGG